MWMWREIFSQLHAAASCQGIPDDQASLWTHLGNLSLLDGLAENHIIFD